MSRRGGLSRRPVLLAAAAALSVLAGHLLDALGLLPGVSEPAAVRAAALAPSYDVLTIGGAALVAVGCEALLRRRRPWLALVALVSGQTALLALPEAVAEVTAGHRGGGGDDWVKVAVAVALQVLLAAAAVGAAVVVDALLLRLPALRAAVALPPRAMSAGRATAGHGRVVGGVRGRGPPVPVSP